MAELTTVLNIISTFALIGALAFTGLQVRTANRVRAEQAALAIIHAIQSEAWARTLSILSSIPSGASAAQIDAQGPDVTRAIEEYGLRLETVGYMVFRGFIGIETIDQLLGGITAILWLRIKPWAERDRKQTANPRQYEWFQWLAERLEDRHRLLSDADPAYVRHADWKQSDARPTT
ncbi:MAG TPA: hypothetical protein VII49_13000 [Rhizomicrobium sp.]